MSSSSSGSAADDDVAGHLLQLALATDNDRKVSVDDGSRLGRVRVDTTASDQGYNSNAGAATVNSSPDVGRQLVNPGRARRADPMDLVHLAESVMRADQFVRATTGGKLMVIVEQIRSLQEKVSMLLLTFV